MEKLDFEGRKAYVRQIDCDYYTDAITYTKVTVLETFASVELASHGEVHVSSRVVGFKKIKFYTNENVGSGELDLPEQQMHTTAYWLTIPRAVMAALPYASDDRRDGVVGLSFAMRQVAQLLLMCDRHDIGISIGSGEQGEQTDLTRTGEPVTLSDEPRIFVYDNYPGGIGFSEPLFGMDGELRRRTRDLIAGCECRARVPHVCRSHRQYRAARQDGGAADTGIDRGPCDFAQGKRREAYPLSYDDAVRSSSWRHSSGQ